MENNNPKKTSLGLDENIEALLCYALGWITGIVFFILEKDSKVVKFHALQSIITFIALTVLSYAAGFIPFIGWLISMLISPLGMVLWILLMYKAYKGEMYKLPIAGDLAEQYSDK